MKKTIIIIFGMGLVLLGLFVACSASVMARPELKIEIQDVEFQGPVQGPPEVIDFFVFVLIFIVGLPFACIGYYYIHKTFIFWFKQSVNSHKFRFPYQSKDVRGVLGL